MWCNSTLAPFLVLVAVLVSHAAAATLMVKWLRKRCSQKYRYLLINTIWMQSGPDPINTLYFEVREEDRPKIMAARKSFYAFVFFSMFVGSYVMHLIHSSC